LKNVVDKISALHYMDSEKVSVLHVVHTPYDVDGILREEDPESA
jgi:hypothetical protein